MMNCGLDDLRLVRPRDGWPRSKAIAAASGADCGARRRRGFIPSVEAAIGDLVHVYAATARDRYMVKRELTPRHAAAEMRGFLAAGEACGVLFGPERTGLVNDQIALADTVLTVPLNPAFSSLNLAQAVLIVGYEWFTARSEPRPETLHTGHSRPANKAELLRFFEHFEEALDESGFLRHPDKRPSMTRNLRNLFQRALAPSRSCAPCTASSPPSWGRGSGKLRLRQAGGPGGDRAADLGPGILLDEMAAADGDFALVMPASAEFTRSAGQDRARLGVDEQLRDLVLRHPFGIGGDHRHNSAGSPSTGISRGQARVGQRSAREAAKGRRYSAISAGSSLRRIEAGSTRSTNMLRSRIISSPAAERKPWNMRREASGHSAQESGRTIASI